MSSGFLDRDTSAPVGAFDSGVGGISVLKHIREYLPHERLIYCADSFHTPYGVKSAEQILARALSLSEFLVEKGVKAIVVACNTATAVAVSALRERFQIPIVGMEPAVKPAVSSTRSGVVGVMATVGTLNSAQFAALLENYGKGVEVVTQGCLGLVECIERGELNSTVTRKLVHRYVEPLLQRGADTIVLGCTHYPFIRHLVEQEVGEDVAIIDTGEAVARQLRRRLEELELLARSGAGGEQFWTSGDELPAGEVMSMLWGTPVDATRIPARFIE